jgi:hypothetical protein
LAKPRPTATPMEAPAVPTEPTPVPEPTATVEAAAPAETPTPPTIGPIEFETLGAPDSSGRREWVRHSMREGLIVNGVVYTLGQVPTSFPSVPNQNGEITTIRGSTVGLVPVPDSRPIPAEGGA